MSSESLAEKKQEEEADEEVEKKEEEVAKDEEEVNQEQEENDDKEAGEEEIVEEVVDVRENKEEETEDVSVVDDVLMEGEEGNGPEKKEKDRELKDKKEEEEEKEEKEEEKEEKEEEEEKEEKEEEEEKEEKEVEEEKEEQEKEGEKEEKEEEEEKEEKVEGTVTKGRRSRKASAKNFSEEVDESKKEKEKEPVTPTSERPTRERKIVERYSAPSTGRSGAKPVSIEKGRGTQLKDIPNVAFKLSRRKPDENLNVLHTILFGKKAKAQTLKKNLGQFSGFVWPDNEDKQRTKVKEKLDKCVKEKLVDFCDVLNISVNKAVVKKEELTMKLLKFLECPHATTDILLADKDQKGKKRKVTPNKIASHGEASDLQAKKQKQTSQLGEKRKQSSRAEEEDEDDDDTVQSPDTEDDSDEENDNDLAPKADSDSEEIKSEEEEDEPKGKKPIKNNSLKKTVKDHSGGKAKDKSTPGKRGTSAKSEKSEDCPPISTKKSCSSTSKKGATDTDEPGSLSKAKGSTSKKQKVEKESAKETGVWKKEKTTGKKQSGKLPAKVSAKDQGKGKNSKKAKAEPTREEMHAVVGDILKEVDFNTATLSDILRQLGTHFGLDLMHRKAEVKDIITDVINDMSDEEDEESAEDGGNADKDEGDDDV